MIKKFCSQSEEVFNLNKMKRQRIKEIMLIRASLRFRHKSGQQHLLKHGECAVEYLKRLLTR
jgi:hypothetical protein